MDENGVSIKGYTYQEYLEQWAGMFGDASTAERTAYMHGKPFRYAINRLDEADFERRLDALNDIYGQLEVELRKGEDADWDAVDRLWMLAFPHEMYLLS